MGKAIQIPEELFVELYKYHVIGLRDADREKIVFDGLKAKGERMYRRSLYTDFRTATDPAQKNIARQKYIDRK